MGLIFNYIKYIYEIYVIEIYQIYFEKSLYINKKGQRESAKHFRIVCIIFIQLTLEIHRSPRINADPWNPDRTKRGWKGSVLYIYIYVYVYIYIYCIQCIYIYMYIYIYIVSNVYIYICISYSVMCGMCSGYKRLCVSILPWGMGWDGMTPC